MHVKNLLNDVIMLENGQLVMRIWARISSVGCWVLIDQMYVQ